MIVFLHLMSRHHQFISMPAAAYFKFSKVTVHRHWFPILVASWYLTQHQSDNIILASWTVHAGMQELTCKTCSMCLCSESDIMNTFCLTCHACSYCAIFGKWHTSTYYELAGQTLVCTSSNSCIYMSLSKLCTICMQSRNIHHMLK